MERRSAPPGGVSRPGIVHRLDRDTSGTILVARDDQTHAKLSRQFADRLIEKEYFALVCGSPVARPRSDRLSDRFSSSRSRKDGDTPRPSREPAGTGRSTKCWSRFDGFAAVRAMPKTGRTHQIRVHLSHVGFPGPLRPSIRRAASDYPGRDSPRSGRRDGFTSNVRRCTRGGCASRIPAPASGWRSRPLCRPILRPFWKSCGCIAARQNRSS